MADAGDVSAWLPNQLVYLFRQVFYRDCMSAGVRLLEMLKASPEMAIEGEKLPLYNVPELSMWTLMITAVFIFQSVVQYSADILGFQMKSTAEEVISMVAKSRDRKAEAPSQLNSAAYSDFEQYMYWHATIHNAIVYGPQDIPDRILAAIAIHMTAE